MTTTWGEEKAAQETGALVERLREYGGEEEVSRHRTYDAARVRVSQMRRSPKWQSLPLRLRASRIPESHPLADQFGGVVYAQFSDAPDDGEPHGTLVAELALGLMSDEQIKEFLVACARACTAALEGHSSAELPLPLQFLEYRQELLWEEAAEALRDLAERSEQEALRLESPEVVYELSVGAMSAQAVLEFVTEVMAAQRAGGKVQVPGHLLEVVAEDPAGDDEKGAGKG